MKRNSLAWFAGVISGLIAIALAMLIGSRLEQGWSGNALAIMGLCLAVVNVIAAIFGGSFALVVGRLWLLLFVLDVIAMFGSIALGTFQVADRYLIWTLIMCAFSAAMLHPRKD